MCRCVELTQFIPYTSHRGNGERLKLALWMVWTESYDSKKKRCWHLKTDFELWKKTLVHKPRGHCPIKVRSSITKTMSPMRGSRSCRNHLWCSVKDRKYSIIHRRQNDLATAWATRYCFLQARSLGMKTSGEWLTRTTKKNMVRRDRLGCGRVDGSTVTYVSGRLFSRCSTCFTADEREWSVNRC